MSGPQDPTFPDSSTSPRSADERSAPARPDYTVAPPPVTAVVPAPPIAVTASFWLWLASFAVGLFMVAYSVSQFDLLYRRLAETVRARQPGIDDELLSRAVDLTLYLGLGGTTAVVLLQLLFAVLMRGRRNWARVLLVVTAAIGVAGALLSLVAMAEPARAALPLQALLILVATVLMFLPAANGWFRQREA